jgi:CDP-diacylglycerol--glycerol-3-phosphate 3-phosphatidyltransferase
MIESLRPLYTTLLKPISLFFIRFDIHPNILTIGGVLLFSIGGWLLILDYWKLSLLFGIIGALMDGLDGIIARETGKISSFGGILDSICDRFTEIIWFGSVIVYYFLNNTNQPIYKAAVFLSFLAATGSIMVSYVRARAEAADIECKKGILQRPERLIILALFQFFGPFYMVFGLGFVAIVSYITVFQRIFIAYKNSIENL